MSEKDTLNTNIVNIGREAFKKYYEEEEQYNISSIDSLEYEDYSLFDYEEYDYDIIISDGEYIFEREYLGTEYIVVEQDNIYDRLVMDDLENFILGWEDEYFRQTTNKNIKDLINQENKYTIPNKYYDYTIYKNLYKYIEREPVKLFDRFEKDKDFKKKIIFNKDLSKQLWDVFEAVNGKEIMFFGEIKETDDENIYVIKSINFPPQENSGAYVTTKDDEYEQWFHNWVLNNPDSDLLVHAHTHPDFNAFSSGTDDNQIKEYIKDNDVVEVDGVVKYTLEGKPFIIQLIVSNPRRQRYFCRWFDLKNDTWGEPEVVFTYSSDFDLDKEYPGIFNLNSTFYDTKASLKVQSEDDLEDTKMNIQK